MSSTATASAKGSRRPRSAKVRMRDVTRSPRRVVISVASRSERRIVTPAIREVQLRAGRETSIGLQGFRSRPCIHAAVRPEKVADDGRRRETDRSGTMGSSATSRHAYHPPPSRRQVAPRSCCLEIPCRRAVSRSKGPLVSSIGTTGGRATCRDGVSSGRSSSTPVVKTATVLKGLYPAAKFELFQHGRLKARR